MAQKSLALKQKIKQKGHWDFTELYNMCFEFLIDQGYKISEDEYTEKISATGKEVVLIWEAKKKMTDYFRSIISLKWHILGMKDVEVERDGKKIATNKGEVKMEVKGELEKDYEKRWEDRPLYKFMRGIYENYIIRTTIDEYEDRVRDDAKELVDQIKGYLQLVK